MSGDPLRVVRVKNIGRYFPVGVAFTWGMRYVAYEVIEHRITQDGVQYRLTEHYCSGRDSTGSDDRWESYGLIREWLRDPRAVAADTLDELWGLLDEASEEDDLS